MNAAPFFVLVALQKGQVSGAGSVRRDDPWRGPLSSTVATGCVAGGGVGGGGVCTGEVAFGRLGEGGSCEDCGGAGDKGGEVGTVGGSSSRVVLRALSLDGFFLRCRFLTHVAKWACTEASLANGTPSFVVVVPQTEQDKIDGAGVCAKEPTPSGGADRWGGTSCGTWLVVAVGLRKVLVPEYKEQRSFTYFDLLLMSLGFRPVMVSVRVR